MGTQYATSNYYREERNTYRQAYDLYLTNEEAVLIVKKICRHYKSAGFPDIKFWGTRDSGSMGYGQLRISNNPSIGLIIHELGHALKSSSEMQKIIRKVSHKGTSHHGLRFQACIWNIHDWAKKKGYWQEELNKKRHKASQKVEKQVAKVELLKDPKNALVAKIENARKNILKKEQSKDRYQKKLKRLQKLYATKTKKANLSIGAQKRALKKYEEELANKV